MQEWQSTNNPVQSTMATPSSGSLAMLFLLNIVVRFDATLDQAARHDLLAKEQAIARAHLAAGRLRHIWRTPAQQGNWSIWEVADPTQLHDIVSSLPLYPWMTLSVHALADHPVSESAPVDRGSAAVLKDIA
jgi:muconolactone D-isomerase